MKKILVALMIGLASVTAYAEASFDQIQQLIEQKQYSAAEKGLEVIIQNHPKSAKAFYAMAQAQAGLGNLEKAQKALDIATGLNPTLDFAPASAVASLKEAITPQTKKIEAVEEGHFWRNFAYFVMFALFGWACYFLWSVYNRKKDEDEGTGPFASGPKDPVSPITPSKPSGFTDPIRETSKSQYASMYRPAYKGTTRTVTPTPEYREPVSSRTVTPPPQPTTTVVNNSSNDLLTGVILGNMMSNHHETTRVVEREVIRETPSRDSSWDDSSSRSSSSSSSSRSSSWEDDSSSRKSSSWDDSSSSSRSSSWDSDSSSSSSSSWDSGSSSSSSSSDW